MNTYLAAFLVGGLICALGQVLVDTTRFTQGHILSAFTVAGGILAGLGLYKPLIDFAGAGATLPISSFGNALAQERSTRQSGPDLWGFFQVCSN